MSGYQISVDREALSDGLRTATTGIRGKSTFKVRLELQGKFLSVSGPGAGCDVPAEGSWPGAVLLEGAAAKALATRLPAGQPLRLVVDGQQLRIGGFSMPVERMDIAPRLAELTLGADSHTILLAVERHGEPRVIASIGEAAVRTAQRAAAQAVNMAFSHLKIFGVRRQDVELCLEASLRRQVGPG